MAFDETVRVIVKEKVNQTPLVFFLSHTVLSYYTLDCSFDIHSHCLLPTQTLIEPQSECNLEIGHHMALKKVYLYSKNF